MVRALAEDGKVELARKRNHLVVSLPVWLQRPVLQPPLADDLRAIFNKADALLKRPKSEPVLPLEYLSHARPRPTVPLPGVKRLLAAVNRLPAEGIRILADLAEAMADHHEGLARPEQGEAL